MMIVSKPASLHPPNTSSSAIDLNRRSDRGLIISYYILSDPNDDHDDSDQFLVISDHIVIILQVGLIMIMMMIVSKPAFLKPFTKSLSAIALT